MKAASSLNVIFAAILTTAWCPPIFAKTKNIHAKIT
jgi:hypothetical protein